MNRTLIGAWTAITAVLALLFVIGLISYAAGKSTYNGDLQEANARARLYASAGGAELSVPSVERKLGADIYAYVRAHNGQLDGFRGDSNRYGGISDAIGEDPFDGVNCSECGPLKAEWETNLEQTALGKAATSELIDMPDKPSSWYQTIGTLLVLWLLVLPVLFVGSRYWRWRREQKTTSTYSLEDHRLLNSLNRQLGEGRDDPELNELRLGLQQALRERATAGEDEKNEMLIERLKTEARDRLDALEAGNRYFERRE